MNRIKITVRYTGYNPKLDELIRKALEAAGFEFEGEGYTLATNGRDIGFTYSGNNYEIPQEARGD